jgi:hypothetical protein
MDGGSVSLNQNQATQAREIRSSEHPMFMSDAGEATDGSPRGQRARIELIKLEMTIMSRGALPDQWNSCYKFACCIYSTYEAVKT